MANSEHPASVPVTNFAGQQRARRLDSWKEIASYLNRSEKTARRWEEREGLPVHRLLHEKRGSVYAYSDELDGWLESRNAVPDTLNPGFTDPPSADPPFVDPLPEKRAPTTDRWSLFAPDQRAPLFHRPITWIVGSLAVAVALLAVFALSPVPNNQTFASTPSPLTTMPGNEVQPGLSPDGDLVAFAFDHGDGSPYHIYVKAIGSETVTQVTGGEADDASPSWSPDGQNIAFLRFISNHEAAVIVLPYVGGVERRLAIIVIDRTQTELRLAWSPDGEWIATSDAETALSPMRLVFISAQTGEKKRLTYQPETVEADLGPSFSPDGRYLAYARHISPVVADIYILKLAGTGSAPIVAWQITDGSRWNRNPVWTADGQEIVFLGDQPGMGSRLWRIAALKGAKARLIPEIGEGISSLTLAQRGSRLVYAKATADPNIWRLLLTSTNIVRKSLPESSRASWVASTRADEMAQYSPDGKYITFQSERSGDSEIWVANSDGSSPRQLTRFHAEVSGYPRWSPDSRQIVLHSRPNGFANIYVIDRDTGAYRQLTSGRTNDTAPSWSHDGRWIYFGSERKDGSQIWRVPAEGGTPIRITRNGGAIALDTFDGRQLLFSRFNAAGLWSMPVEGGVEKELLPSLYGIDTFAVGRQGVYFVQRTAAREASLDWRSLSTEETRHLASIKVPVGSGLTISPDERSILYTQLDQAGSDLFVLNDFR